jgi:hypothetical protein
LAEYIPRINLPIEGVEHARWLEKRSLDHERRITELERLVAMLLAQNNTGARAGAVTNTTSGDVPLPALTGGVLRGAGPSGKLRWTYEWQGLLPQYNVTLSDGAPYSTNGPLGLSPSYETDYGLAQQYLPPVEFDDDGHTLLPIDFLNYSDPSGGEFSGAGQAPIHLQVEVEPLFNGDEFTIHLPPFSNANGATTPFYTFVLKNISLTYTASVNIEETDLYYPLSDVPVNGDVDTWSLAPSYEAGWHVKNVLGFGAVAEPAAYTGSGGAVFCSDPYYAALFW